MSVSIQPIPNRRRAGWGLAVTLASLLVATIALTGRGGGISGRYEESAGLGSLEFRGGKVYVTTVVGSTFVAPYEVDGSRIILKGPGGSRVLTRVGDSIHGGVNMTYIRVDRE